MLRGRVAGPQRAARLPDWASSGSQAALSSLALALGPVVLPTGVTPPAPPAPLLAGGTPHSQQPCGRGTVPGEPPHVRGLRFHSLLSLAHSRALTHAVCYSVLSQL